MIENLALIPLTTPATIPTTTPARMAANSPTQTPNLLSQFAPGDPRRLEHLSLQQQKKRAKELLREWRNNPTDTNTNAKLNDAQRSIAQSHGFRNWSELKAHIEQSQIARDTLAKGEPSALDANQRVLHIRCGHDIQHALALAGFNGDFLAFPDVYVHGPVPETANLQEFIQIRASYLSSDHHPSYDEALKNITENHSDLDLARNYDAVYLWMEHDSHDQLVVAKLLDYFSDIDNRPPVLKMINITHFPGVKIFNGIGQLPAVAMRILWGLFTQVTPEQLSIGKRAWAAVRSSSPQALQDLIATATPEMPTMAIALNRHLKQLPSTRNGLNLTENLTLQILDEKGAMNAARLFGWYTNHYEPLTFMGDSGYWNVLEDLASAKEAAIILVKQGEKSHQWQVELSDIGRELLNNKLDWLTLNHIDRWVGGIHIDTKAGNVFRVNDSC